MQLQLVVAKPPPPIRYGTATEVKNGESTLLYYNEPDGRGELGVLFLSYISFFLSLF